MAMREPKRLGTILYSAAGVALMAGLLLAVNVAGRWSRLRLDLTGKRLHTVTPATRQILRAMDADVTIRFYRTRDSVTMPAELKLFADRAEDLLREFQALAGGRLKLQLLDPKPDSDAEDSANLDGVSGQPLAGGEPVYLGLAVHCLDQVTAIPFLSPQREGLLEYDLLSAISRVLNPKKPVVGVLGALPLLGRQNPMFMAMGRGGQPPWVVAGELQRSFKLQELPADGTAIPADVEVLLLAHPKELPQKTLFAIDQFLLRGGRLLAFLDPLCYTEARILAATGGGAMGTDSPPGPSTLGPLLKAWGVSFATDKVAGDLLTMAKSADENGQPLDMPAVLQLTRAQCDPDDPATAELENLLLPFAGWFEGAGAAGLARTILLTTSERSAPVDAAMAEMGPAVLRSFKGDGLKRALAIRLTGHFKTAFPGGPPDAAKPAGGPPAAATATAQEAPPPLKGGAKPGVVILVGDADLLYDQFAVQVRALYGQRVLLPLNDNLDFVQNLMDQLGGDPRLIGIRSRGTLRRPFTKVNRMQAEAEEAWRVEIDRLEKNLEEVQGKLQDLQLRATGKDQKVILSPEQQRAITAFKQQQAETRQRLKEVRKQLRQDIERLESRLEWLNIAAMPALVGLVGLGVGLWRKRRR